MSRQTYQLSLLDEAPKLGREYLPPVFLLRLMGLALPPDEEAARQIRMLTPDTQRFANVQGFPVGGGATVEGDEP